MIRRIDQRVDRRRDEGKFSEEVRTRISDLEEESPVEETI